MVKLLISLLLLISINGFGQNKKYKNITISGNEQMLPVFIQVKHSVELKDTIKLSPDLELILGTGCFGVDMIHIKGTNYYLPISGRGDSMWLYIKPNLINGSSFGKVHIVDDRGSNETFGGKPPHNNSLMTAPMTFVSPFDTVVNDGVNPKDTSFELSDAARKVFEEPKTDTVKGIITYYKYLSKTDIYHHYMLVQLPAIAIYKIDSVFEQYTEGTYLVLLSRWRKTRELLKILVNNKPFDLSKHYEFLRDDEIVK